MSVLFETSLGDLVIDLEVDACPRTCENFLKLCKVYYYNLNAFFNGKSEFVRLDTRMRLLVSHVRFPAQCQRTFWLKLETRLLPVRAERVLRPTLPLHPLPLPLPLLHDISSQRWPHA